MLSWLRRPSYDLLIEPERITLANRVVRVEVEPRLSVAESGRVLEVGAGRPEQAGEVVELLGPVSPEERPQFEKRLGAFVAVFRHLILAAQKNSLVTLRPDVRVHGASVLRPLFDGQEQTFLRDALVHAGATKVEFVPER
jgi:hypothetical protein